MLTVSEDNLHNIFKEERVLEKISLDKMKELQVNMLEYINEICKKYEIQYFLLGGSLIGAIRHNGFIPWDDDIDIGLTIENYNKLCDVLKKNNNGRYKLVNHEIQKDYYYPFAKLIDTKTLLIEKNFKNIKNYGVYIDIFAYHTIPADEKNIIRHYNKVKKIQRQIFYYSLRNPYNSNLFKNIIKMPLVVISKIKGIDLILKQYNKELSKYSNIDSKFLLSNWPFYKMKNEIQNYEVVKEVCYHKFENIEALIPVKYDEFLRTVFGDYMKLPPEEERVSHHNIEIFWKNN